MHIHTIPLLAISTLALSAVLPILHRARNIDQEQEEDGRGGYNIRDRRSFFARTLANRDADVHQIEDGRGGYNIRSSALPPRTLTFTDINDGNHGDSHGSYYSRADDERDVNQAEQDSGRGMYSNADRDVADEQAEAGRGARRRWEGWI